jgi:hypothetical protein
MVVEKRRGTSRWWWHMTHEFSFFFPYLYRRLTHLQLIDWFE